MQARLRYVAHPEMRLATVTTGDGIGRHTSDHGAKYSAIDLVWAVKESVGKTRNFDR